MSASAGADMNGGAKLSELDESVLRSLGKQFEPGHSPHGWRSAMQECFGEVYGEISSAKFRQKRDTFAIQAREKGRSASFAMVKDLSEWGMTVDRMIALLERNGYNDALACLQPTRKTILCRDGA